MIVELGEDRVFGTPDDRAVPVTIRPVDDDRLMQLITEPLTAGLYQLRFRNDAISDRPRNILGTETATSAFEVGIKTIRFALGGSHVVTLYSDGTLWAWGYNRDGQLGDGTSEVKWNPVPIVTDHVWSSVAAGPAHTLALEVDGSIWTWGFGLSGTSSKVPVPVGNEKDWSSIFLSDSSFHSFALKTDDSLWAWGPNDGGQLGDGTTENRLSPVRVATDTDWVSVTAGRFHTVGLKRNGTLWAWGYTFQSTGFNVKPTTSPTQVGSANDWTALAAGEAHVVALKSDGTLWGWGLNKVGQLGIGSQETRTSPTSVGTYRGRRIPHTCAQK